MEADDCEAHGFSAMKAGSIAARWTGNVTPPMAIIGIAVVILATVFGWALGSEHWVGLGAVVLVSLVPVVIRWPVISAFGLYVFLVPFDSGGSLFQAGGGTVTKLVGILAGAILLVAGLMERRLVRPPMAAVWFGLFVLWAALSASWAIDPDIALGSLRSLVSLFLLYAIAVCFRPSRNEFHAVCLLTAMGGAIIGALVYQYGIEVGDESVRSSLAIREEVGNPNTVAAALILPMALGIGACLGMRSVMARAGGAALVGLIGLGMYWSMSRSAVVSILVMISVFLYRVGPRRRVVIPIMVLTGLTLAVPETFYERIAAVFSGVDATGSGRTEIWKVGIGALERFGILGAGLENFRAVYSLHVPEGPRGVSAHAHNMFLATWVELGIIGLMFMLAALASHLRAAQHAFRAGGAGIALVTLEAACFGRLASGMFLDELYRKWFWLSWILLVWAVTSQRSSSEAPVVESVGRGRALSGPDAGVLR